MVRLSADLVCVEYLQGNHVVHQRQLARMQWSTYCYLDWGEEAKRVAMICYCLVRMRTAFLMQYANAGILKQLRITGS